MTKASLFKYSGVFFLLAFMPLSVHAFTTYPVPDDKRIQITEYSDDLLHQLKTSGDLIHWWNSTKQQLFVYGIEQNQLVAVEEGTPIFDLQQFGSRFVLMESDQADYFVFGDSSLEIREEVRPGRSVSSVNCFDGDKVGYLSNDEFHVYDVETGVDQLVSFHANGSFFFCSISQGYVSFNASAEPGGSSRVWLSRLSTGIAQELSQTGNEGRSSVILGDTVYFVEGPMIYSHHIPSGERGSLHEGEEVGGYVDQLGIHYLTFHSRVENTLVHPYLAFPNKNNLVYRFGDINYWQSGGHMFSGIYTWFQLQDGQMAVFATNFLTLDTDGDRVRDIDEIFGHDTDPFSRDSDGDGFEDGVEIENGFSPIVPADTAPESTPPISSPPPDSGSLFQKVNSVDVILVDRVVGHILLQVEDRGEAWYVDPRSRHRYYMKDGQTAFEMLRAFGLGITNKDLERIPISGAPAPEDLDFVKGLAGRILIQVEENGEAWYVNPETLNRTYLKDGEAAFTIMREQGLGITTADLAKISYGILGETN